MNSKRRAKTSNGPKYRLRPTCFSEDHLQVWAAAGFHALRVNRCRSRYALYYCTDAQVWATIGHARQLCFTSTRLINHAFRCSVSPPPSYLALPGSRERLNRGVSMSVDPLDAVGQGHTWYGYNLVRWGLGGGVTARECSPGTA